MPLTASSWGTLAIFLLSVACVIHPVRIRWKKRVYLYFNLATAPPLGVLLLLLCQIIPISTVGDGCVGSQGVEPYAILILFYSLAYLCLSLDSTGLFQYLALWVSQKAGQKGHRAFTLFFVLTSVMSALTSNDVVILTGTVFLSYFTRVNGIYPTAFLMSEFTTANIASMALYIGNPTNVVVAQAYDISFIGYSAWMLLPTVVTLVLAYGVLRLLFCNEKYLPRQIQPPTMEDPKAVLLDPRGAFFGTLVLGLCLATLVGTSFAKVPVWWVTLPFAVIMLGRDLLYDTMYFKQRPVLSPLSQSMQDPVSKKRRFGIRLPVLLRWLQEHLPTVVGVGARMPWSILPFSLGMFVLVEALVYVGWVGVLATALNVLTVNYVTAVYGVMAVSILACQCLNNLPMTLLLIRMVQHPNFGVKSEAITQGVMLGLIVGSNLGACLTLVGSLAGIMFDHILKSKNMHMLGYMQFLKWNLVLLPVLALGAGSVVIGEIWFVYDRK